MPQMDSQLSFAEYYWDYRNRVISDIVLFTVLRIVLQVIGMFGNVSIAIVTIQYKHFRGTCGILLAVAAVSDSLHQLSHYYFGYLTLTGINFTSLKTCVIINVIPLIGLSTGMLMTLFIGVDRALSVIVPAWHRNKSRFYFLSIYFSITVGYNLYFLIIIFKEMLKEPEKETICLISDAQPGYTGLLWFDICLVLNVLTICCYIVVWIGLKVNSAKISGQKMIRSLSAITAVVFLGWALNAGVNVVASFFNLTPVEAWYVGFYIGIMINIAVSSNYFVLFLLSNEYRIAFKKHLNFFTSTISGNKIFTTDTRVMPTSQMRISEREKNPPNRVV